MKKPVSLCLLAMLLAYALSGCGGGGPSPSPTPTETPEPGPPPPGPRCGDGVCDGPENPQNCPQDCPQVVTPPPGEPQPPPGGPEATAPPSGEPSATQVPSPVPTPPESAEEWEGNVDFTCEVAGSGTQYFWRAYIDFEFTVAPDGSITGSGAGEFFDDRCTIDCGSCEFSQLGPISAQVSGSREDDFFHLSIVPSAEMVARHVCDGRVVELPQGQLGMCVFVPGGPNDFTIEARDNAWVEWQGSQGGGAVTATGVSAVYLSR